MVLIVLFVGLMLYKNQQNTARKLLREAHKRYLDSVEDLKHRPSDPDLRQHTLHLGRTYSNLTRNMKGVTLYDEVALANDISAACAAAAQSQQPITSAAASIEDRLTRLNGLLANSLITDAEYRERRAKLLDEV